MNNSISKTYRGIISTLHNDGKLSLYHQGRIRVSILYFRLAQSRSVKTKSPRNCESLPCRVTIKKIFSGRGERLVVGGILNFLAYAWDSKREGFYFWKTFKVSSQSRESEFRVFSIVHLKIDVLNQFQQNKVLWT